VRQSPTAKFIYSKKERKVYNMYKPEVKNTMSLRQRLNPSKQTIPMFSFSSILQKSYILDKFASPLSERAPLISKDFPISKDPYVPTCSH
jgi:hypothetical protein